MSVEAPCVTAVAQRPAPSETWSRAAKRTPKPTPASSPSVSPEPAAVRGRVVARPRRAPPRAGTGSLTRETSQMPGMPVRTASTTASGGQPLSATPTATGSRAAPTALTGATTLILPVLSPRKRNPTPMPEPTPPSTAQARSAPVGSPPRSSAATVATTAEDSWTTTATDQAEPRRLTRPPMKSDEP